MFKFTGRIIFFFLITFLAATVYSCGATCCTGECPPYTNVTTCTGTNYTIFTAPQSGCYRVNDICESGPCYLQSECGSYEDGEVPSECNGYTCSQGIFSWLITLQGGQAYPIGATISRSGDPACVIASICNTTMIDFDSPARADACGDVNCDNVGGEDANVKYCEHSSDFFTTYNGDLNYTAPFYTWTCSGTCGYLGVTDCVLDCPICGDAVCSGNETCNSCSLDCGQCCGNGNCDIQFGENHSNCEIDCPSCGDGICDEADGEDCSTCSEDCGQCIEPDCGEAEGTYSSEESFPRGEYCAIGNSMLGDPFDPQETCNESERVYTTWTCQGSIGQVNCSATRDGPIEDAVCGPATGYNDGNNLPTEVSDEELCDPGVPVSFEDHVNPSELSYWSWTCNPVCLGDSTNCRNDILPIEGTCGSAAATYNWDQTFSGFDYGCDSGFLFGSVTDPPVGGCSYWNCLGRFGGSDSYCAACRGENWLCPVTSQGCTVMYGVCAENGTQYCDQYTGNFGACYGTNDPRTTEIPCNGADEDCDGVDGDTMPCSVWFDQCEVTGSKFCWDSECFVQDPRTPEVCDGIDNDCDGITDEDSSCGNGCIGAFLNAEPYPFDLTEVNGALDSILVNEDTIRKCEWHCITDYFLINQGGEDVCVPIYGYECIAPYDGNTLVYPGDDLPPIAYWEKYGILSRSNSERKCEYYCDPNLDLVISPDMTRCIPRNDNEAICGDMNRIYYLGEDFPGIGKYCEVGAPLYTEDLRLSEFDGAWVEWKCVARDLNSWCRATRREAELFDVNAILDLNASYENNELFISILCSKRTTAELTLASNTDDLPLTPISVRCDPVSSRVKLSPSVSLVPQEMYSISASIRTASPDCSVCSKVDFINIPPAQQNQIPDNSLVFVLIILLGVIFIVDKKSLNFKNRN